MASLREQIHDRLTLAHMQAVIRNIEEGNAFTSEEREAVAHLKDQITATVMHTDIGALSEQQETIWQWFDSILLALPPGKIEDMLAGDAIDSEMRMLLTQYDAFLDTEAQAALLALAKSPGERVEHVQAVYKDPEDGITLDQELELSDDLIQLYLRDLPKVLKQIPGYAEEKRRIQDMNRTQKRQHRMLVANRALHRVRRDRGELADDHGRVIPF